jgi:hypothetical protein
MSSTIKTALAELLREPSHDRALHILNTLDEYVSDREISEDTAQYMEACLFHIVSFYRLGIERDNSVRDMLHRLSNFIYA